MCWYLTAYTARSAGSCTGKRRLVLVVATFSKVCKEEVCSTDTLLLLLSLSCWFLTAQKMQGESQLKPQSLAHL